AESLGGDEVGEGAMGVPGVKFVEVSEAVAVAGESGAGEEQEEGEGVTHGGISWGGRTRRPTARGHVRVALSHVPRARRWAPALELDHGGSGLWPFFSTYPDHTIRRALPRHLD